jgi:hypothetical protein
MMAIKSLVWCATILAGVWFASEWWETSLARPLREPIFSPNGCYRVDRLRPFWVLPDIFHRESHPDEDRPPTWFPRWGNPGFYRLYDLRTGELLGQSKIYDLESASGSLWWGDTQDPIVSAGLIPIGPGAVDCLEEFPPKREKNP